MFFSGEKTKKTDYKSHPAIKNTNQFISYNWSDRLKIKNKYFFNKDIKTKYLINRGNLIHDIMAQINIKEDINPVINRYIKQGLLNKNNSNTIKKQIQNVLSHAEIGHLFTTDFNVFSEYNILSKNGDILRPDRVVLHSKEVISLIDYKTVEKRNSDYIQMRKYEKVLLDMGFQKVDKYLVYLTKSFPQVDVEKIL